MRLPMNSGLQPFVCMCVFCVLQKKIVDWVLGYGSATVTVQFPHGWKNLQVTTLQAAILLVFNVHPTATVGQMADLLKIEMGTLRCGLTPQRVDCSGSGGGGGATYTWGCISCPARRFGYSHGSVVLFLR